MEEVVKKYPSICYECENARKTASEEIEQGGYVGCCMFVRNDNDSIDFIEDAVEVAEGWVDLRARPFSKGSGIISNLQLITLKVTKCHHFKQREL